MQTFHPRTLTDNATKHIFMLLKLKLYVDVCVVVVVFFLYEIPLISSPKTV